MLYLIQVISYSALMCLLYVLLLRNRPMHGFNRLYLLAAAIAPVLVPLIRLPESVGEQISEAAGFNMRLPEFVAGDTQQAVAPATDFTAMIYFGVSAIILGSMLFKWYSIRRVINKHERVAEGRYTLVLNSGYGPGSWHRYIFLPDGERNETIIAHEAAHVKLRHTADIMLLSLVQVLFWPNLLLVWIKKELMQVHEFQADALVAKDKAAYSELLVSTVFGRCTLPLSHSFIIHPIRRRLRMLGKGRSPISGVAGFAAVAVTSLLLVAMVGVQSCKEKKWEVKGDNKVYTGMEVEKMAAFPGDSLVQFMINNVTYPQEAKAKKIEGEVIVEFTINVNGEVTDVTVKESPDEMLTQEALRVVNKMPQWIPAENNGKKVAVKLTLPIRFSLS